MNSIENFVYIVSCFYFWYLIVFAVITTLYVLAATIKVQGSPNRHKLEKITKLYDEGFLTERKDRYTPFSVIIPAFNEEKTICETVKSLLYQDYPDFGIIIVDDGSTDHTKDLVIETFGLRRVPNNNFKKEFNHISCKPVTEIYSGSCLKESGSFVNVIMICKENGGRKADALNAGINFCDTPWFVTIDADEILNPQALKYINRVIKKDESIIGACGCIKIANFMEFDRSTPQSLRMGKNLVCDMQILEYGRLFGANRIAFDMAGHANPIVSGGYAVFRKDAVVEVGGYDVNNLGEDMELTLKLQKLCHEKKDQSKIVYVPESICYTQAPSTLKDLLKQRQRWTTGFLQSLSKYKRMIMNPGYRFLGLFVLPFQVLYELLPPVLFVFGIITLGIAASVSYVNLFYSFLVMLLYTILNMLLSLTSAANLMYLDGEFSISFIFRLFLVSITDAVFFRNILLLNSLITYFRYPSLSGGKWFQPRRTRIEISKPAVKENVEVSEIK